MILPISCPAERDIRLKALPERTMTRPLPLADLGIPPRLLSRVEAATYCRLSPQGFSRWVRTGRLPGPIAGTARWDLRAIDAALDLLSGIAGQDERGIGSLVLDQWKAKHARSS